jgi:hypothetical protein
MTTFPVALYPQNGGGYWLYLPDVGPLLPILGIPLDEFLDCRYVIGNGGNRQDPLHLHIHRGKQEPEAAAPSMVNLLYYRKPIQVTEQGYKFYVPKRSVAYSCVQAAMKALRGAFRWVAAVDTEKSPADYFHVVSIRPERAQNGRQPRRANSPRCASGGRVQ